MAQEHPLSFNFKGFNFKDRISGKGFLAIATIIFGASNSVSRRLQELGDRHLVDGRNPISFCNSLFVGNLSALIILTALYHQDWNLHTLKQIKLRSWILLRDSQRNNSPSF